MDNPHKRNHDSNNKPTNLRDQEPSLSPKCVEPYNSLSLQSGQEVIHRRHQEIPGIFRLRLMEVFNDGPYTTELNLYNVQKTYSDCSGSYTRVQRP